MKLKAKIKFISLILLLFLLSFSFGFFLSYKEYYAQDAQASIVRLDKTSTNIDKYFICRNIINYSSKSYMIPFRTKEEWCSFIKRAPALGLVVEKCMRCYWTECWCTNCRRRTCEYYNTQDCP